MTRHERWLAELALIAAEYEEKLRPEEWVQSRLRWEDWATLRPEAVVFATEEIRRRKWRGTAGGVLPQGFDAEGIVNEVIGQMMEGKCKLAMGWTRERLMKELKRLVSHKVRALHRLKEAGAVRSEWEGGNGEGVSLLKGLRADGEDVAEAVCQGEEESWRGEVLKQFEAELAGEPQLEAIFGCLRAGLNESKEIASQLGMDEAEVVKGRKKLVRRAGEFERRWNRES